MTAVTRPYSGRSNVIVASHERSGTHFLINTLALNFGFAAKHIDSDITSGADFYIRSHFQTYLECLRHAGSGRIIKEHHHLAFFEGMLDRLRENFVVFYVYRNPADVMCSLWRYVRDAERREGPLTETAGAFMRVWRGPERSAASAICLLRTISRSSGKPPRRRCAGSSLINMCRTRLRPNNGPLGGPET
jgi:hypothetical protein